MIPVGPYETETAAATEEMPRAVAGLTYDPDDRGQAARDLKLNHLLQVCTDASVQLGRYDKRVVTWLCNYEPAIVQVVVGLIGRATGAGTAVRDNRVVTAQDLRAGDLMAACIDRGVDIDPADRQTLRAIAGLGADVTASVISLISQINSKAYAAGHRNGQNGGVNRG